MSFVPTPFGFHHFLKVIAISPTLLNCIIRVISFFHRKEKVLRPEDFSVNVVCTRSRQGHRQDLIIFLHSSSRLEGGSDAHQPH